MTWELPLNLSTYPYGPWLLLEDWSINGSITISRYSSVGKVVIYYTYTVRTEWLRALFHNLHYSKSKCLLRVQDDGFSYMYAGEIRLMLFLDFFKVRRCSNLEKQCTTCILRIEKLRLAFHYVMTLSWGSECVSTCDVLWGDSSPHIHTL